MFWINHTAQGAPLTISGSGGDPPQIHAPRHQPRDFLGPTVSALLRSLTSAPPPSLS